MDTRFAPARPFTRADRCDRCSAAAQIRATLTFGELLFCGHHIRAYRDHLVSIGAVLDPPVDQSGMEGPTEEARGG